MANKTQYAGQKRKQPTTNVSMAKPKKQYVFLMFENILRNLKMIQEKS